MSRFDTKQLTQVPEFYLGDPYDVQCDSESPGPTFEVDAGRYYATVVNGVPWIFRADGGGAVRRIFTNSLPTVQRCVWDRWFRRFGVAIFSRDHGGQYGPVGARSRTWTITAWWLPWRPKAA